MTIEAAEQRLTIEVFPHGKAFQVFHDREILIETTADGFYDSARALLAKGGFDPDDTLVMIWGPLQMKSLSARLGYAASQQMTGLRVTKLDKIIDGADD